MPELTLSEIYEFVYCIHVKACGIFREHYLTAVTWASDTQLYITYLNRKAVQSYRTDFKEKCPTTFIKSIVERRKFWYFLLECRFLI
jgi:hypothetical protein